MNARAQSVERRGVAAVQRLDGEDPRRLVVPVREQQRPAEVAARRGLAVAHVAAKVGVVRLGEDRERLANATEADERPPLRRERAHLAAARAVGDPLLGRFALLVVGPVGLGRRQRQRLLGVREREVPRLALDRRVEHPLVVAVLQFAAGGVLGHGRAQRIDPLERGERAEPHPPQRRQRLGCLHSRCEVGEERIRTGRIVERPAEQLRRRARHLAACARCRGRRSETPARPPPCRRHSLPSPSWCPSSRTPPRPVPSRSCTR